MAFWFLKGPSIKNVRKIFRKTNISNPLIRQQYYFINAFHTLAVCFDGMRLRYVYTSLALFPSLYISYRLNTHSIATNRYNIVVPSNQFNLITRCKVLILSSVHFLEFFDTLQWATICSVCWEGTRCLEAFFRKSLHELVRREEVVEKNMVI